MIVSDSHLIICYFKGKKAKAQAPSQEDVTSVGSSRIVRGSLVRKRETGEEVSPDSRI